LANGTTEVEPSGLASGTTEVEPPGLAVDEPEGLSTGFGLIELAQEDLVRRDYKHIANR
jgi:hypothetical protein